MYDTWYAILTVAYYLGKVGYHTMDITIAGLEAEKTDFAKGECEVGRSDPAVQRTHFVA